MGRRPRWRLLDHLCLLQAALLFVSRYSRAVSWTDWFASSECEVAWGVERESNPSYPLLLLLISNPMV